MTDTSTGSTNTIERILVSVEDAAVMVALCRATVFRLIGSGEIRTVKYGRRTLVPVQSLREWAASLQDTPPTPAS